MHTTLDKPKSMSKILGTAAVKRDIYSEISVYMSFHVYLNALDTRIDQMSKVADSGAQFAL